MFEKLKSFCDSFLDAGLLGFDLMVYKDVECVLRYINGYNDRENKVKMTGKERYFIYSCSKPITCTAAMQLFEKGLFSLDDRLSDYMPEFKEMTVQTEYGIKKAEKPILIKHLFEMTAGFSYEINSPWLKKAREETNGRCPTRETMKYLAKEPLLFEPGDSWKYSLCHDVLAAFVEVVSGEKFEEYVKKNILDVCGMNDSTFLLPESEIETTAFQYVFRDGRPVNAGKNNGYVLGTEYVSGGAGAVSTVEDYMKFLEALRTYKLLKPETLKLMTTDRMNDAQRKAYASATGHGYGLGVRCERGDNDKVIDFGWGGAAGAYLAIDMKNNISIYMGSHLRASPVQGLRSYIYRLVRCELIDEKEIDEVREKLKSMHDYNLTY